MHTPTTSWRIRLSATFIVIALVHGSILHGFQRQEGMNWEAVADLLPKTPVRVVFLDGAIAEGVVVEIDADSIVLRQVRRVTGRIVYEKRGKARVFNRQQIWTVDPATTSTSQRTPVLINVATAVMVGVLAVAIIKHVADKLSSLPVWSPTLDGTHK
jgi:hypothetical protein